jgi:hypothetical protein
LFLIILNVVDVYEGFDKRKIKVVSNIFGKSSFKMT